MLNSVEKVVQFVFTVEHCKVCEANSDEKFLEVAKRRDGIFKDQSGKIELAIFTHNLIVLNRYQFYCKCGYNNISFQDYY